MSPCVEYTQPQPGLNPFMTLNETEASLRCKWLLVGSSFGRLHHPHELVNLDIAGMQAVHELVQVREHLHTCSCVMLPVSMTLRAITCIQACAPAHPFSQARGFPDSHPSTASPRWEQRNLPAPI